MRRSGPGVAIGFRNAPETARLRALDNRGAVGEQSVRGLHRTAERVGDDRAPPIAAERRQECVHRPFAAVGHWQLDDFLPAGA